jgi:hypothetical protein
MFYRKRLFEKNETINNEVVILSKSALLKVGDNNFRVTRRTEILKIVTTFSSI